LKSLNHFSILLAMAFGPLFQTGAQIHQQVQQFVSIRTGSTANRKTLILNLASGAWALTVEIM